MGDLSAHFSRSEFRDKEDGSLIGPSPRLVAVLERIRTAIGRPLPIVSGYRTRAHQARENPGVVGYHPYGLAADVPVGLVTVRQARAAGATGIGYRGKWAVHVDVRPGRRVVTFPD